MKKAILAALLCALLLTMTGCNAVDEALGRLGDDIKAAKLDTPKTTDSGIDWSYVPVVREMAVSMFTEAFPDATVTETSVREVAAEVLLSGLRQGISVEYVCVQQAG